jgi:hypothetical protein
VHGTRPHVISEKNLKFQNWRSILLYECRVSFAGVAKFPLNELCARIFITHKHTQRLYFYANDARLAQKFLLIETYLFYGYLKFLTHCSIAPIVIIFSYDTHSDAPRYYLSDTATFIVMSIFYRRYRQYVTFFQQHVWSKKLIYYKRRVTYFWKQRSKKKKTTTVTLIL